MLFDSTPALPEALLQARTQESGGRLLLPTEVCRSRSTLGGDHPRLPASADPRLHQKITLPGRMYGVRCKHRASPVLDVLADRVAISTP